MDPSALKDTLIAVLGQIQTASGLECPPLNGATKPVEDLPKFTEELGDVTLLHFDRVQDKDTVLARLPGIHTGLRGNTVKLTAEPPRIHVFHEGVSLYYR